MKRIYRMENLECAHCAARMEDAIRKLPGVTAVSVNFLTQKFTLEAEDAAFPTALQEAVKICRRIEPDCKVILG
jgi:copper chaperone CopZ